MRTTMWCARALLAACLATLGAPNTARAAGASIDAATADQTTAASEKYRAGMDAFGAQKFPEALALFHQSYDVVASPNSHLMIGRTLAKMGKLAEAYAEIKASIAEATDAAQKSEKYRKTLDAARAELDDLKGKVGFVVVGVQAEVTLAGRKLASSELGHPIVADPGTTEVVLKLPSGEETRQTVDVRPGAESHVDLAPGAGAPPAAGAAGPGAPCPTAEPAHSGSGIDQKVLAAVSGGVAVLGFATFGVFGVLNNKAYSDLQNDCPGNVCPRDKVDAAERGRQYQTLANVGLGVGATFAVTGLVLFLTAPSSHAMEMHTGATSSPSLAVGPGQVAFRGRF